jgi:vacuolar-type H+-ATPase subunit H
MIEDFIHSLQAAETEAGDLVEKAQQKAREIEQEGEAALGRMKAERDAALAEQLAAIDEEADGQIAEAERLSHVELARELELLDDRVAARRPDCLKALLSRLLSL